MSMSSSQKRGSLHAKQTLALYARATLRYKMDLLTSCAVPLSNLILGVVAPYFASKVLANIVAHGPTLWSDFYWFAGSAVAALALNIVGIRIYCALQAKVLEDLHVKMFSKLLDRSVGFYNNQIGGKLVSDAIDFVTAYGQLDNAIFLNLFGFTLTTVVGLAVIFASNWMIGFAVCLLLIGLTYWTVVATGKRSMLREARLEINKKLTSHLADNFVNAITVKTFAQEQTEIARNQKINRELRDARITDWQRTATNENSRMGVLLLMQVALIALIILTAGSDTHSIATGIFAFTYTLTLINRFIAINSVAKQIEDSLLMASPMTVMLQQSAEVQDVQGAKPLVTENGAITLTDVTFRYADSMSGDHIFDGLSFSIPAGQKVGLVGHSGGGKSTLTRLLLRFDDVSGGTINIDGQDISQVTQASLRRAVAYVPQEPLLFHRSIRENIAYGNLDATDKAIKEAARLAYAHDFISQLPSGYDTIVGERGVKLSGGQRQRIAIARAILKNSPILVLDEATSALDSESEKAIQKALWELMDNKTAVVIAHRLSTIQKMDRILVLDDGRIVEDGDHKSLLQKKNGIYAKLWVHQSGGFIEE